jgi:hypothetical protein
MNLNNKHNKKSDYVGNHGGAYLDGAGNSRQFTYIDHDSKLKKSFNPPMTEEELKALKAEIEAAKKRVIEEILALPAVNLIKGNELYEPFVTRSQETGVTWNVNVLTGACMLDSQLATSMWTILWKNTVKEQYWWDDLTHEEILAGKWKELI